MENKEETRWTDRPTAVLCPNTISRTSHAPVTPARGDVAHLRWHRIKSYHTVDKRPSQSFSTGPLADNAYGN